MSLATCVGWADHPKVGYSVPGLETTIVIRELDRVVLTTNLRKHGLKRGDVGTVVLRHGSRGYEVEFMTLDGQTVAVVSVTRQ